MEKYHLLFEQLKYEGYNSDYKLVEPKPIDLETLHLVHHPSYVNKLIELKCSPREQRVSGFEHNEGLIFRERVIMEGTRLLTQQVIAHGGIGINIAGGTHHAYADRGEGFCLFNDFAISAAWFKANYPNKKVTILDLDVHQGNGTAAVLDGVEGIRTISFHGKNNYPLHKETSTVDIAFADGTSDEEYLQQLSDLLETEEIPDLLFYLCGVDVLSTDKLGKLGLSLEGCKQRDELVLFWANENAIPVVCAMGGGYSPQVSTVVNAHIQTFRLASNCFHEKVCVIANRNLSLCRISLNK